MTAVDVCRLNKHDSPDLVYGRHDGTVLKRIISAFSFRPTIVATVPVHSVFSGNPYMQRLTPTITNIAMINVRLLQFQTSNPVQIGASGLATPTASDTINLEDALNQTQIFIEGNMLVPRVTKALTTRGVMFFYIDRRAHVLHLGMRHFNLNHLPKSVAGLERINKRQVNIPPSLKVNGSEDLRLVSGVLAKTHDVSPSTTGAAVIDSDKTTFVIGSQAFVTNTDGTSDPSKARLYDPMAVVTPSGSGPTADCWTDGDNLLTATASLKTSETLSEKAVILMYQSPQQDGIRGIVT